MKKYKITFSTGKVVYKCKYHSDFFKRIAEGLNVLDHITFENYVGFEECNTCKSISKFEVYLGTRFENSHCIIKGA